jgi:hypothetical protein
MPNINHEVGIRASISAGVSDRNHQPLWGFGRLQTVRCRVEVPIISAQEG